MEIKMISTRANPLLGRREIAFEVVDDTTPSRESVRKMLASTLKVDLDLVWVRKLETQTGTHRTVGLAHVYEDGSRALLIEPKYIIVRNRPEMGGEKRGEG
jgi:ribosomal protein S24E